MGVPPSHHPAYYPASCGIGSGGSSHTRQSKRQLSDYCLDEDGFEEVRPPPKKVARKVTKRGGKQQQPQSQQKATSSSQRLYDEYPPSSQESEESKAPKEKRLRKFRPRAPQNFYCVWERATSQRFFVLGRSRCGLADCPEEFVEMTGSTGNVYLVHIARQSTCTCPHAEKGNQCKHMLYVMSRVLRAPFHLVYQLALLSSELCEIFRNAPPIEISDDDDDDGHGGHGGAVGGKKNNRKTLEGDCPICFCPFEESESTVYCRATCGQNLHAECFQRWAASKQNGRSSSSSSRDGVTCPMCRSPWQGDDDVVKKISMNGAKNSEGYINVASQLGISGVRDSSTYHYNRRRGWW